MLSSQHDWWGGTIIGYMTLNNHGYLHFVNQLDVYLNPKLQIFQSTCDEECD